jgi:glutamate--cysteine ligase
MVRKLRVSLALQPLATALFANSPFTEGKPNGFLSNRAQCLDRHRQPARSGIPAVMFEPDFGFERYVEWLLDVPMYFVYRDGRYIDRPAPRSAISWPAGAGAGGPAPDHGRFRRPHDHAVHRCPAQAVPGNARRGCGLPT